jgi:2-oxoglutarate dehydrogenase E2 component (dihydrolipoamide succinyltransferase)
MSKFELEMPKMGESIAEGTIINWLIAEGDSFEEGDIILEVATDKVDNEVPAPVSGILVKTIFHAKDVVPVGEVLAILEVSEEAKPKSENAPISEEKKEIKKERKKQRAVKPQTSSSQSFNVPNSNNFFSPLIIEIAKTQHISF